MQLAKIEFDLSPNSLVKAKKKLVALKKDLNNINDIFLHRSMDFLCDRIQKNIEETTGNGTYQVTGTLLNEFGPDKVIYEGKTLATLISHCGYSAFVEYGTGVVGAGDPHPNAGSDGWQYDATDMVKKAGTTWTKKGNFISQPGCLRIVFFTTLLMITSQSTNKFILTS